MPQYRYAFDAAKKLVDAACLPKDRAALDKSYVCVGCGRLLTAKTKGEKKVKHFAHAVDQQGSCSEESYLHKLGKAVFLQTYSACLEHKQPFTIQLVHPTHCSRFSKLGDICVAHTIQKEHDLTKHYDQISEEKRDGSFVPDLLLTKRGNESRPLYIEIVYSHPASDQKRESGKRIIEIRIVSEDDLEKIRRRKLLESDAEFINFKPEVKNLSDLECSCAPKRFYFFRVFRAGNCLMKHWTPLEIQKAISNNQEDVSWWRVKAGSVDGGGSAYVSFVEEAHSEGAWIRNCFVCRYSGRNFRVDPKHPVFCKLLTKPCRSTEALDCDVFRPRLGNPNRL